MTTVQRGVDNCVRQARRCVWIDLLRVLFLGALATSCRMSDKAPSSGDSTPTGDSATPVDDCDPADGLGVVTVSVSLDPSDPLAEAASTELAGSVFLYVIHLISEASPGVCSYDLEYELAFAMTIDPEWSQPIDVPAGYICSSANGGFIDPDDDLYWVGCDGRADPVYISACGSATSTVALRCTRTLREDEA